MAPVQLDASWTKSVDKVIGVPLERAWRIAKDFVGFPGNTCGSSVEHTAGKNGVPGCVRKVTYSTEDGSKKFACEELVSIDDVNHCFSYKMVDGDDTIEPGFQCFVQLTGEGEGKTRVQWPFCFTSTQTGKEILIEVFEHLYSTFIGILEKKGSE